MKIWNKENYEKMLEQNGIKNYNVLTENCIMLFYINKFGYGKQCHLDINPKAKEIILFEEQFYKYKGNKTRKAKFFKREVFKGEYAITR